MPVELAEEATHQGSCLLRETHAAATSAEARVTAMWFMHSTAINAKFHPSSLSSRISRAYNDMYMEKRVLKQDSGLPRQRGLGPGELCTEMQCL